MKNYYFKLKVDSKTDSRLIDFTDPAFVNATEKIKNNITSKDGKAVLKWNMSEVIEAPLPEMRSIDRCPSIRFSVYSEKASGASVRIWLMNPKKPGGNWGAAIDIPIDFEGWKNIDVSATQISGAGARDNSVASLRLAANKLPNGSLPTDDLYITSIEITTENYSFIAPDGVDASDPALYKAITDNARDLFIGNDASAETEAMKAKLPTYNEWGKTGLTLFNEYRAQYGDEMVENKLFGIVVEKRYWAGEIATQKFYDYVFKMAIAWGTIGSDYYKNGEILEAIKFSLEYGYKFYNGPSLIEYGAYGNWWQWEIGIPINLLTALIIIEDELTPELCKRYTTVFDHYVPYPAAKGGNKIWLSRMCVMSAALRRDALSLCIAGEYMNDLFDYINNYITDEGGFFRDGSFIQHAHYAYTTGYGGNYTGDLPQMMYYLHGTRFYPQQENVNNMYEWVLNAIRPVVYNKCRMNALAGRNVGRYVGENSRGFAGSLILLHSYAPEKYKAELEAHINYFMKLFGYSFADSVPKCMIKYADELYERLKNVPAEPYELTRVFSMMSRTVHHGKKYGACLSTSSPDIGKYESINFENRVGWYHGDGMLQVYTDDYSFDGNFYCYGNPYFMPGVTANTAPRKTTCTGYPFENADSYAGGVADGKYGCAGFILKYNEEGASTIVNTTFEKDTDASIYAKKSYFFFDDEIVCVGSDISDRSGTAVKTTLDNRFWRTEGDTFTVGSEPIIAPATDETEISARAVHFTNMGGYVLLGEKNGKLSYKKATNGFNGTYDYKGNPLPAHYPESCDFLELYIDHGVGARDCDKYFYAYLPTATVEQTNAYLENPDVTLLAQNCKVHAVCEKKLGIVAANFFEGAEVQINEPATAIKSIGSETPCSVMIAKCGNGEYKISAADPTRALTALSLTLQTDGISKVISADANVNAVIDGNTVKITVNSTGSLGMSCSVNVK